MTDQDNAARIPKRRWDSEYKDMYQAQNSTWYLRYWSPSLGREIEKSLKTAIKGKALKERKRILENLGEQKDKYAVGFKTFKAVVASFQAQREWGSEATRLVAVNQFEKHLLPWFKNYAPERVDNKLWRKYSLERRKADPECSLYNARKYLGAVLKWAHENRIIKKEVQLDDFDEGRESPGVEITLDQFNQVFAHLSPEYQNIATVAWEMGMRIMEIKKLEWDRVNFLTGEITLRKEDTKNRKARKPTMTPLVSNLLSRRNALLADRSIWAFPNENDPAKHYSTSDADWQRAKKRVGAAFRFHDIRHTWLTNSFRQSNKYAEICEYAGLTLEEAIGTYVEFKADDMRAISNINRGTPGRIEK